MPTDRAASCAEPATAARAAHRWQSPICVQWFAAVPEAAPVRSVDVLNRADIDFRRRR